MVIGEEKGAVICARSRWMIPHSLEILDIAVFYRILGEDQIKLEKAVYRQMDWEGTIQADGEGRTSRRYIYICNAGEHSLFAGGLIEKTELFGNYFAKVKLEEAKKGWKEMNGTGRISMNDWKLILEEAEESFGEKRDKDRDEL